MQDLPKHDRNLFWKYRVSHETCQLVNSFDILNNSPTVMFRGTPIRKRAILSRTSTYLASHFTHKLTHTRYFKALYLSDFYRFKAKTYSGY